MCAGITLHELKPASRSATRLATAAILATASFATAAGIDNTLFLHHFDVQNTDPIFAGKPGNADYANGSSQIYTEIPPFSNAPGGQLVSSPVKFGANGMNGGRDLPIVQVQAGKVVPLYPAAIQAGTLAAVAP